MLQALSLLVGFAFGSIFAFIEHRILLNAMNKLNAEEGQAATNAVLKTFAVRYIISIAVLIVVFLTRNLLPFDFFYTIIGAAVGLTVPAQLLAMRSGIAKTPKQKRLEKQQERERIGR